MSKTKMNLSKTITTYDRDYNYTELMVKTIQLNSYFIIRAKKSTFKKWQSEMERTGKTDKIHILSLNAKKLNRFHSPDIKEYAEKFEK